MLGSHLKYNFLLYTPDFNSVGCIIVVLTLRLANIYGITNTDRRGKSDYQLQDLVSTNYHIELERRGFKDIGHLGSYSLRSFRHGRE